MTARVISFLKRPFARNQARANLYAVEAIVRKAGLGLRIGHGTTDEGDPWISLTGSGGEFVGHVAYIDGEYVIDTPAFSRAVWGRDLTPLVDTLIQGLKATREGRRMLLDNPAMIIAIGVAAAAVHLQHSALPHWQPLDTEHKDALPQHFTVPDALLVDTSLKLLKAARDAHLLDWIAPKIPAPEVHAVPHTDTHVDVQQPQADSPHQVTVQPPTEAHETAPTLVIPPAAPITNMSDVPVQPVIELPKVDPVATKTEVHASMTIVAPPSQTQAVQLTDAEIQSQILALGRQLHDVYYTDENQGMLVTLYGVGIDVDQSWTAADGSVVHMIGVAQEPPQH